MIAVAVFILKISSILLMLRGLIDLFISKDRIKPKDKEENTVELEEEKINLVKSAFKVFYLRTAKLFTGFFLFAFHYAFRPFYEFFSVFPDIFSEIKMVLDAVIILLFFFGGKHILEKCQEENPLIEIYWESIVAVIVGICLLLFRFSLISQ